MAMDNAELEGPQREGLSIPFLGAPKEKPGEDDFPYRPPAFRWTRPVEVWLYWLLFLIVKRGLGFVVFGYPAAGPYASCRRMGAEGKFPVASLSLTLLSITIGKNGQITTSRAK